MLTKLKDKLLSLLIYTILRLQQKRKNLFVPIKFSYFLPSRKSIQQYKSLIMEDVEAADKILSTPAKNLESQWGWNATKTQFFHYSPKPQFLNYEESIITKSFERVRYIEGSPINDTQTFKNVLYIPEYRSFYLLSDGSRIKTFKQPKLSPGVKKSQEFESLANQPLEISKIKKINQKFMFGGEITNHFGHFFCDSIAHLWYLAKGEKLGIITTGWFGRNLKSVAKFNPEVNFVDEFMRSLYLFNDQFIHPTKPVILEEIVIPYPSSSIGRREIFEVHKLIPELVAQRLLPKQIQTTDQPIYFSRTRLRHSNRRILNEDKLEKILLENNFTIVYPETLTLKEQIFLVNKHKFIVGTWGSAFHTILFSLSDQKNIVSISDKDLLISDFFLIDALKSVNSTYIAGIMAVDNQSSNTILGDKYLDMDVVLAGLKSLNLI